MTNNINIYWPKIATFSIAALFFWIGKGIIINSKNNQTILIIWYILLGIWSLFLIVLFFTYYKKEAEKSIEDKYHKIIQEYETIIDKMKSWFDFTSWLQKSELERTSQNNTNKWFINENVDRTEI
jgi:steroid 5-alpha reductase family enzyme